MLYFLEFVIGSIHPLQQLPGFAGDGLLYMSGEGVRFEPFDTTKTPLTLTWEQFDNESNVQPTEEQ